MDAPLPSLSSSANSHTLFTPFSPTKPHHTTREMIASLNISLVLHGTHKDREWDPRGGKRPLQEEGEEELELEEEEDPFQVPKEMGIFQEISR